MERQTVITHALNQGVSLAKASDRDVPGAGYVLCLWGDDLPIGAWAQLGRNNLRALAVTFDTLTRMGG